MSETIQRNMQKPTGAFVGASWAALFIGSGAYLFGLWNADMQLNEKGYYFTLLLYGLFASVSLQKSVRDKLEGIHVTGIYYGICWVSIIISLVLLGVGLWNATFEISAKGFYAMAYLLALFASIAVQKNIRDLNVLSMKECRSELNDIPEKVAPMSEPKRSQRAEN
ncbi:MAG: hypothetical protein D3921_12850 [Candidatus Electrothrix sp. AW1]|nr:hypothetical protein [Candidatus Electrothrix sp. AX1]MCI5183379.1 hypothetical protein [Candidatus Electrothrix gigas]